MTVKLVSDNKLQRDHGPSLREAATGFLISLRASANHRLRTDPGSWTGPLRQSFPGRTLNLQSADLPVEEGDKDCIVILALVVVAVKDAGCSFQQGLLPGLDPAGMDS